MPFWKRLRLTLDMIKFEHSVFALPFALTGALLAFRENHLPTSVFGEKLLWIIVAMVGARSNKIDQSARCAPSVVCPRARSLPRSSRSCWASSERDHCLDT